METFSGGRGNNDLEHISSVWLSVCKLYSHFITLPVTFYFYKVPCVYLIHIFFWKSTFDDLNIDYLVTFRPDMSLWQTWYFTSIYCFFLSRLKTAHSLHALQKTCVWSFIPEIPKSQLPSE